MRFQKLGVFVACAFSLCACAFVRVGNTCVFARYAGERAFYLYSASSQAQIKNTLTLAELNGIKGESVTITQAVEEQTAFLQQVLKEYRAQVLWEETCADVTSYYCYSPRIQNGTVIEGQTVNLHIAFGTETTMLGTPLIFGGF